MCSKNAEIREIFHFPRNFMLLYAKKKKKIIITVQEEQHYQFD